MAVVTRKSAQITTRDTVPFATTGGVPAGVARGRSHISRGSIAVTNGDSATSVFIACSIPSSAFLNNVMIACDAVTSLAGHVGLAETTQNGGAVVSAQLFATAQSFASALGKTSVLYQSGNYGKGNNEKRIWQVLNTLLTLGLTQDPGKDYDVIITVSTGAGAGGNIDVETSFTYD